jgi:hypothetical protein
VARDTQYIGRHRRPERAHCWCGAPRARPGKVCARGAAQGVRAGPSTGWCCSQWKRPFDFPILESPFRPLCIVGALRSNNFYLRKRKKNDSN